MNSPTPSPLQSPDSHGQKKATTELGPAVLLCICYIAVGIKFFRFISRYSVNLFYWDHWDFENGPLFQHHSLWEIFRWQHGPHRQGFGGVVSALIDPLFRWNSRVQAFEAGILVLLASLCALWLKRRLYGEFEYFDLSIPFLFLVRNQAEAFVAGANISHGPMPLLLVVLYCLVWTLRNQKSKYSLMLVVNFLLLHTGFGLFMGVVTPLLLAIDLRGTERGSPRRTYSLLVMLAAAISLAFFFVGYRFDSASPCISANPRTLLPYLWFVALMFPNFAGVKGSGLLPTISCALIGVALVTSFVLAIRRLVSQKPADEQRHLVIAALSGYALLFVGNTAIGRICLGITAGQQPRYVPYLIIAFLGLYLASATIRTGHMRTVLLSVFLVFAAWCSLHLDTWAWLSARNRSHDQGAWRECYLQRESVEQCDSITGSKIYPSPEATHLQEKLQFLKRNHLNLYSDQK